MVDFLVPGLIPACAPAAPGPSSCSSSSSSSSSSSHLSKDLSTSSNPSSSSSSVPSRLTAGASEPPPTSAAVFDDGASDIAVLRQYIDLFEKTSSFALDSESGQSPVSNPGGCRLIPRERPAASLRPSSDPRGPAPEGEESGDQATGNRTGAQGAVAGAGSAGDKEADPAASELHSMLGFRLRSTLQLLLLLKQTEVLGMRLYRILCEQRRRKERLRRQGKTSSQDGDSHEMIDEGGEEALVVSGVVDAWTRTSELSEGQALRWIFARYRSVRVLVALEAWLQWEARHLAGLCGASASSPVSLEGSFSGAAVTGFRNSAERHMQSARIPGKKAPNASDLPSCPTASAAPSLFYHADWPYVLPGASHAWRAASCRRGAEAQLCESPPSSGSRSSFSHSAPLISEVDRRETRAFFAGVWQLLRMGKLLEAEKQAVERGAAWLVEVIRGDEPWMEPYVYDDVDLSLQVEDVFTDHEIRLLSDASPILKACLWPSGYSLQHVALAAREEGKEELRGLQESLKNAELEKKTEKNAELCSTGAFALKNAGIAAALDKKQMGWYGEGKKGRSLLVHVCQRILAKQQDPTVSLSVSSSAPLSARISPRCTFDFAAAAGKGAVGVLAGLGVGEKVETQKGGFGMESFEQAIYGYLSGSLEAMEHVSTGWADCLFALVRAVKASLIDGTLRCMRSHEPHGRFAGEPRRGGFLPPVPRRKNGKCCSASPAASAGEVNRVPSASFSSRTEGSVSASPRKKRRTLQEHGSSLNDFSASRGGVSPQSSPRSDLPDGYLSVCAVGKGEEADEEGAGTLRRRKSLYDPLRILLTDFLRPQSAAFEDDAEVAGQERKGAPDGEAVETPEEESGEKTCCCGRAWIGEEAEWREASPALPPGDEGLGVDEGGDALDCVVEEAREGGEGGRNERIDEESSSFSGEERCAKQVDEGVLALLFNIMNDLPLFLRRFVPSAHSREQIVTEGADELRLLQLFLVFLFLQNSSSPPTGAAGQERTGEAEETAAKDEREERSLYAKSVKKLLRKTFRHGPRLVLPRKSRVEGAETEAVDLVTVSCSPSLSFQEFTAFFVVLQGDLKQPFLAFPSSLSSPAAQLSLSLPVRSPLSPPRGLRECDGEEDAQDAEGLSVRDADFLVGGFIAHVFQQLPVCDVLLHVKIVELLRYVSSERRVKLLGDWLWRRFAARYWESREGRELLEECVSWIATNFPQDVLRVALRCAERSWHCSRPLVVSGRGMRVGRGDRDADSEGGEDESNGPGDCAFSEGRDEEETDAQDERLIFDERREETAVERLQFSVFLVLSVFSLYYVNRKFQSHADQPLALLLKDSAATSSLLPLSSVSSASPPPSRWLLLLGLYCLGVIAHLGLLGLCLDFRGLVRLTRSLLRQNAGRGPVAETSEGLGERGAPKASLEPNAPEGAAR
ncbi:putative transmembrane protein, partial [Toxoplasma gondii TgCatPRC2]